MIEWWFLHLRIPAREAETATRAVAACTNRVKACQFALIASVCSDCASLVHSEVSAFRSRNFCFFAVIGGSFIPTCSLAFWCYRLAAAFSKAIAYHIAGCIFDQKNDRYHCLFVKLVRCLLLRSTPRVSIGNALWRMKK